MKSAILSLLIFVYYVYTCHNIYRLVQAPRAPEHTHKTDVVLNDIQSGEILQIDLFISQKLKLDFVRQFDEFREYFDPKHKRNYTFPKTDVSNGLHVGTLHVPYNWDYEEYLKDKRVSSKKSSIQLLSFDPLLYHHLNISLPVDYRQEKPVYLHTLSSRLVLDKVDKWSSSRFTTEITKMLDISTVKSDEHNLLHPSKTPLSTGTLKSLSFPREIMLGYVVEHEPLHRPSLIKKGLGFLMNAENQTFQLPLLVNVDVSPRDEYTNLNSREQSEDRYTIRFTYQPLSFEAWLLQSYFGNVLDELEGKYNFPKYDIDSLKQTFSSYSPWITVITFTVSGLHLLFETLSLTSEVSHWYKLTSFTEFSSSSLIYSLVLDWIIYLYLIDRGESKIIIFFSLGRAVLHVWKLYRMKSMSPSNQELDAQSVKEVEMVGADINVSSGRKNDAFSSVHQTASAEAEEACAGTSHFDDDACDIDQGVRHRKKDKEEKHELKKENEKDLDEDENEKRRVVTDTSTKKDMGVEPKTVYITEKELNDFEHICMRKMFMCLIPIISCVALYQLINLKHKSWYSWLIQSLAMCAYAGGFVSMTPQLLRNYKLESVDHMPWLHLTYQAFNTFIDDLFAFIIRMPNMHRISVFRDDIIFFIFHYQRYMYKNSDTRIVVLRKERFKED